MPVSPISLFAARRKTPREPEPPIRSKSKIEQLNERLVSTSSTWSSSDGTVAEHPQDVANWLDECEINRIDHRVDLVGKVTKIVRFSSCRRVTFTPGSGDSFSYYAVGYPCSCLKKSTAPMSALRAPIAHEGPLFDVPHYARSPASPEKNEARARALVDLSLIHI